VNGLELIVSECNGHERRQCGFMEELFPRRETRSDLSRRGRDVGSSCDRAARLANPILNLAKTSGRSLMPLDARHEFFVQLAGKPDAKAKLLEARDSVLKRHYVIANFAKILGTSIHDRSRFSGEEFTQRCLCAFNLAR
jgi:hypothetical protein